MNHTISKPLLEGYLLEETAKSMKKAFAKKLTKLKVEVTVDQWIILDQLSLNGAQSQYSLCLKTSKDAPTITRIIDLLEKKDLVARNIDPKDRRKFLISLSRKGKSIAGKIRPHNSNFRDLCYKGLNGKELSVLKKALQTINSNLEKI